MKSLKNQDGFVAITALIMMLVLSIFGIILQSRTMQTLNSMKNTENYAHARDVADATMEYLQFKLKDKGAGFNLDEITCTKKGESSTDESDDGNGNQGGEGGGTFDLCQGFDSTLYETKDIKITAEIKGRNREDEYLTNCSQVLGSANCYVVPALGTGTAGGKNCKFYTPKGDSASKSANTQIDDNGKEAEAGTTGTPQIDYSCNWNKLIFGSSLTDRAAIPFYYTTIDGTGETKPISPYNSDTLENGGTQGTNFVVRIRPPCKPIPADTTAGTTNATKEVIPTDCANSDRYVLNSDVDDIVVQWQISGQCKDANGTWEECGMIQYAEKVGPILDEYYSGINEGRINYGTNGSNAGLYNEGPGIDESHYRLVYPVLWAYDTSDYNDPIRIAAKKISFIDEPLKLPTMRAPVLTLFLSSKLIDINGNNIPYLEYQVLTDEPIGDSRIRMDVTAEVNGNIFNKTIFKEEKKALIDFAVQN